MPVRKHVILTLTCADRLGIVSAVAGFLTEHGCNIVESAQFGDQQTGRFFMRVCAELAGEQSVEGLKRRFAATAAAFSMTFVLYDKDRPVRTLIMLSKQDHCLRDLVFRTSQGELNLDIVGVVSNHADSQLVASQAGLPFHVLPMVPQAKVKQEEAILNIAGTSGAELIILARYMQILSPGFCASFSERIINIHHSFLPSFKGSGPYKKAHSRGVKLIGATAHYATPDLDEGPIIEQETARVTHRHTPRDLIQIGRDLERMVLARAVRLFAEHRVLLNGNKTVIFD